MEETEARERRRARDHRKKLEQLDDVAREVLADAAAVCRSTPPAVMTLLELITRANGIRDIDEDRKPRIVKRRRDQRAT